MFAKPVVFVVGETLVDVVRRPDGTPEERPGGSSANTAVALGRLGRETWLATALGEDARGQVVSDHLAANQVRLAGDPWVLDRTSVAMARLGSDGSATYDFDLEWRLPAVVLPDEVDPAVVVFGSIGAALAPGADEVARLVESLRDRALSVLDLNVRPAVTGLGADVVATAEQMAGLADVVKASDEDLRSLWPHGDIEEVAARLLARGTGAVVVTEGAKGIRWVGPDGQVAVPAQVVEVVDTIGAGDTVTAALVDGLWRLGVRGPGAAARLRATAARDREAVLRHAVRAAAVTVSRAGADPPWRRELESA